MWPRTEVVARQRGIQMGTYKTKRPGLMQQGEFCSCSNTDLRMASLSSPELERGQKAARSLSNGIP
jgi:hypothetical protein